MFLNILIQCNFSLINKEYQNYKWYKKPDIIKKI